MKKKKKKVAAYIDAENVSAKDFGVISAIIKREGILIYAKEYGLKNDNRTKRWSEIAGKERSMEDIRLCGKPKKNKVDKVISRDMENDLKINKHIDTVILFSADHGYAKTVEDIKKSGIEVIVAGRNISNRLKGAAGVYCEIE